MTVAIIEAILPHPDLEPLPAVGPIAVLVGLAFTWVGLQTWRGTETRRVDQWLRTTGPVPGPMGGRRVYQSVQGASYIGIVGGPVIAVWGVIELMAVMTDQTYGWLPLRAAVGGFVTVATACGLFVGVYFWAGVPDSLRPPAQRGWQWVDQRLLLVRPGDTESERAERAPITPRDGKLPNEW